jgi:CRP-like cAMP-binding protein
LKVHLHECFYWCRRLGRLGPGQYFGERACWTAQPRLASVVTITSAELYCLKREALKAAAQVWPDLKKQLLPQNFRQANRNVEAQKVAEDSGNPPLSGSTVAAGLQSKHGIATEQAPEEKLFADPESDPAGLKSDSKKVSWFGPAH